MRVLLVEDDHILGAAVRDHLVSIGHGVDWARRFAEAYAGMSNPQITIGNTVVDLGRKIALVSGNSKN